MHQSLPNTPINRLTELAHRSTNGLDVSLLWESRGRGDDENTLVVCVCDQREGTYFEIPAEPHLALDVYYHPFAYRNFSTVDYHDDRLAA